MNAFFKSASTVLGRIWVWSLLLVLSCAVLVWYAGPLLAVDDYRFWQSQTARLVTLCALFLLWGLAMVVAGGRRASTPGSAEREVCQPSSAGAQAEQKQVRGRFKEAVQRLKTSRRYAGHNARWRNDLPWYLLIGGPGSGKTHLLAAAGLQSPLDHVEARATHGTAHCEWYFADEGVLIDTPGRYLTQPDSVVDAAGWSTLLSALRLRRRVRPLNGVVVTLSVDALLSGNEHDLDLHARRVHSRLQEVQQTLHVDVPVYLVLTQADRVPGFAEFFDASLAEDAESVLGEFLDPGAAGIDVTQVRQAFEALLQGLSAELMTRLHQERNVDRRGRMLDFPSTRRSSASVCACLSSRLFPLTVTSGSRGCAASI
ncbi:type VI secretion protein IcmF/TssM N-terminal domain-containing protein [Pseudomonas poae]|uniref:type VI secretion protein IcmF/TssM N-terminal domain-containing protein n=1 Tax=Pseudomonas poae TaxID=200451 RepID=UPI003B211865